MFNQWNGKKWYCYGTSMTDNAHGTGFFSKYLALFAGLEEHNFGKGSSGIVPALHGDDSVKTRVMRLDDGKQEADLITVEVIPNDMKAPLGEVCDVSDETFCGNLNQVIEYLQRNTKAYIAILTASRGRYNVFDEQEQYTPYSEYMNKRIEWERAIEEICKRHSVAFWNGAAQSQLGYYRSVNNNQYVTDQIHLTDEGGKALAKYYWGKLRNAFPIKE